MEAPARKFNRLVTALDDLVGQEAATLRAGDFTAVGDIQRRTGALVEGLSTLGAAAADAIARARVAAVLARRQHNLDLLESQLATARSELLSLQEGARRIACIAPAYYGRSADLARPRLNATG